MWSYLENRGGESPETVFFGLQYYLQQYLNYRISWRHIDEARELLATHFGPGNLKTCFNDEGWSHIANDHGGFLPLKIRAVPEGSVVPTGNILMSVENTCPQCFWLTNYVETLLSMVWYTSAVATLSRNIRQDIKAWMRMTCDSFDGLPYKLHNFGFRGSSSVESAGLNGVAHLTSFLGTDTLEALRFARDYYFEPNAGFSIPASEHSTISSWGRGREVDAYSNMLDIYPDTMFACVSDTWDIYNACENIWGGVLRDRVLGRKAPVVIRPDSGYPPEVCLRVIGILGERFGYRVNNQGYKLLHPNVRVIQGDGVDRAMINKVLRELANHGWSADNIAFGSGGALVQNVNRDTHKQAIKCSAVVIGDKWHDVYKDPVTDPGKRSKRGLLKLVNNQTVAQDALGEDMLWDVYDYSKPLVLLHNVQKLDAVRKRAQA